MARVAQGKSLSWQIYLGLGVLWFLSMQVLSWTGVQGDSIYLWVMTGFIAVFAAACGYNGQRCGAVHCRINGPAYTAIALISALSALGIFNLTAQMITIIFLTVTAASFAIEWWLARKRPAAA